MNPTRAAYERKRYDADHHGYCSSTAREVDREHLAGSARADVEREARLSAELLGMLSPVQRALLVLLLATLSLSTVRKIASLFLELFGVGPATRFLGVWIALCRRTPAAAPGAPVEALDELAFDVLGHALIDSANQTTCTDADDHTLVDRLQERAFEVRSYLRRDRTGAIDTSDRADAEVRLGLRTVIAERDAARAERDRFQTDFANCADVGRRLEIEIRTAMVERNKALEENERLRHFVNDTLADLGTVRDERDAARREIETLRKTACLCTSGPNGQQCQQCARVNSLLIKAREEGRHDGIEQCVRNNIATCTAPNGERWFMAKLSPQRGAEPGAAEGPEAPSAVSMGVRKTAGGATPPDGSSGVSAEALRLMVIGGYLDDLLFDLLLEAIRVARRDELGGVP